LARARSRSITSTLLKSWALKTPGSNDSKEERGRVLVVGGEREIPGAVLLSGLACLRAGAGKLQIATCESTAVQIGVAVPEARVIGLEETSSGSIRGAEAGKILEALAGSESMLVGPGMTNKEECASLIAKLLPHAGECIVVLDAGALSALDGDSGALPAAGVSGIITPHAGEMAKILELDIETIQADPALHAMRVAESMNVIVILKGPETHIASPGGDHFVYRAGDVGLATSGSGDILAGIIAGLAARSGDPLKSAVWGVFLHGEAGNTLAKKSGRVGYLARELLDEVPPILNRLTGVSD
jgi:ADP-dependent NAD(P)H-hydrate dehydratase